MDIQHNGYIIWFNFQHTKKRLHMIIYGNITMDILCELHFAYDLWDDDLSGGSSEIGG